MQNKEFLTGISKDQVKRALEEEADKIAKEIVTAVAKLDFFSNKAGAGKTVNQKHLNTASEIKNTAAELKEYHEHLTREIKNLQ